MGSPGTTSVGSARLSSALVLMSSYHCVKFRKWFFKRIKSRDSVLLSRLLLLVFSFPYLCSSMSREEPFLIWTLRVGPSS